MIRLTFFILFLSCFVGYTLFQNKHQVIQLEKELNVLNQNIIKHQQAIHVLEAEWHHLNDPKNLEYLAKKYLPEWKALTPQQIVKIKDIPFENKIKKKEIIDKSTTETQNIENNLSIPLELFDMVEE